VNETSYTKVSAEEVVAAAEGLLQRRAARIERERNELINQEMSRRFFPAKTREQAVERLKARDGVVFSPWRDIEIHGGLWANRAESLRRLALASVDGVVFLCADDADLIHNHRERMKEQA
jgi:hypothetical protein